MAGELRRISRLAARPMKITPKVMAWLAGHPEGVVIGDLDSAKLLLALAQAADGRAGAFHPSSVWQCPRKQVLAFHGLEPDHGYGATLQNIFNDGTWRHIRWQLMLTNMGLLTQVEVPVAVDDLRFVGSMDGTGADPSGTPWMFELKGTSASLKQLDIDGPQTQHVAQVQAYLWASNLDECVMVYESKLSQEWVEFIINRDNSIIGDTIAILEELNHHVDVGTLPAIKPDCARRVGEEYQRCPYRGTCLAGPPPVVPLGPRVSGGDA